MYLLGRKVVFTMDQHQSRGVGKTYGRSWRWKPVGGLTIIPAMPIGGDLSGSLSLLPGSCCEFFVPTPAVNIAGGFPRE
jgi:hypothetical protein